MRTKTVHLIVVVFFGLWLVSASFARAASPTLDIQTTKIAENGSKRKLNPF